MQSAAPGTLLPQPPQPQPQPQPGFAAPPPLPPPARREVAGPLAGAVAGTVVVAAAAALLGDARGWAAWALRVTLVACVVQLSVVVHHLGRALGGGAPGSRVVVPGAYWVPFAGLASAAGVRADLVRDDAQGPTRRLVGAQAGFAVQVAYVVGLVPIVLHGAAGVALPVALAGLGMLAYVFAYAWLVPYEANDLTRWYRSYRS